MDWLMNLPGAGLLGYVVPFLLVLTIVVFFHELGHFLVARWNGVKVDAFSVGFGRELWGFTDRHGTRWKLSAIPLGGYVKFYGDDSEASTPDFERARRMDEAERAVSFMHKPVWRRASIVAAGPIANFILAIVIFSVSFMTIGRVVTDPIVTEVVAGSPAEKAGFKVGDLVRDVDGNPIESFNDIKRLVSLNLGREMVATVERDGARVELRVTPRLEVQTDQFGNRQESGLIGIVSKPDESEIRVVRDDPLEAVAQATKETWFVISTTVRAVGEMLTLQRSPKQIGGPIQIAKASGDIASLGIAALISWVAFISVSIGLLNLFPIPLLDGGHLVFYAIEAIRGRPLSERAQEYGFRAGLAVVLMLMLFATFNDVTQIFLRAG